MDVALNALNVTRSAVLEDAARLWFSTNERLLDEWRTGADQARRNYTSALVRAGVDPQQVAGRETGPIRARRLRRKLAASPPDTAARLRALITRVASDPQLLRQIQPILDEVAPDPD